MQLDVDQSGKVGDKADTVIAVANQHYAYTVLIPRQVRRDYIAAVRQRRRKLSPEAMYLRLFVIGVYFAVREVMQQDAYLRIDQEYPGKEADIKGYLLNYLRRRGITVRADRISFGEIGKQSPAHIVGLATYRKERPATLVLTLDDVLGEL